mgnify:CR=1 FL=1
MELLDFAKTDTAARLRAAAKRGALSHALILSGSGDRVSAARYAAAAMECTAESKPCLACPACRKVMQDIHPDVTFVRDAEHKEISIDTVRAMRADAFIRPNEGARKVYIFEDCTILTEKDQNVLLKLVEEGPAYAAFFFCAENPAVLLLASRVFRSERVRRARESVQCESERHDAFRARAAHRRGVARVPHGIPRKARNAEGHARRPVLTFRGDAASALVRPAGAVRRERTGEGSSHRAVTGFALDISQITRHNRFIAGLPQ